MASSLQAALNNRMQHPPASSKRQREEDPMNNGSSDDTLQHTMKRLRMESTTPSPTNFGGPIYPQSGYASAALPNQTQFPVGSSTSRHTIRTTSKTSLYPQQQQQQQQQQQHYHHQHHQQHQHQQQHNSASPPNQTRDYHHNQDLQQHQQPGQNSKEESMVSPMNRLLGSLHQQRRNRGERSSANTLPSNSRLY